MEQANNPYGVPGGSGGMNSERRSAGPATGQAGTGATATGRAQGPARTSGTTSGSLFPPRVYSFRALVAMGLLGFVVGRICR